jgi:hypothetical protein
MKSFFIFSMVVFPLIFSGQNGLCTDCDGDGYISRFHGGSDCNDHDSTIFPGAAARRNYNDCNCDGIIGDDEELGWIIDLDGSLSLAAGDLLFLLRSFDYRGGMIGDINQDRLIDPQDVFSFIYYYEQVSSGF